MLAQEKETTVQYTFFFFSLKTLKKIRSFLLVTNFKFATYGQATDILQNLLKKFIMVCTKPTLYHSHHKTGNIKFSDKNV